MQDEDDTEEKRIEEHEKLKVLGAGMEEKDDEDADHVPVSEAEKTAAQKYAPRSVSAGLTSWFTSVTYNAHIRFDFSGNDVISAAVTDSRKKSAERKKATEEAKVVVSTSVTGTPAQDVAGSPKTPSAPAKSAKTRIEEGSPQESQLIFYQETIADLKVEIKSLEAKYDLLLSELAQLKLEMEQSDKTLIVPKTPVTQSPKLTAKEKAAARKKTNAECAIISNARIRPEQKAAKEREDFELDNARSLCVFQERKESRSLSVTTLPIIFPGHTGHYGPEVRILAVWLFQHQILSCEVLSNSLMVADQSIYNWEKASSQERAKRTANEHSLSNQLVDHLQKGMTEWRKTNPHCAWPSIAVQAYIRKTVMADLKLKFEPSRWTVKRAFDIMGAIHVTSIVRKPLTIVNKAKRLEFCRFHLANWRAHCRRWEQATLARRKARVQVTRDKKDQQAWGECLEEFMSMIIFTDEKIFTVNCGHHHGYQMPEDPPSLRLDKGRYSAGQMCWSGICLDPAVGVIGPKWIVHGTMNTTVYAKLIQEVVTCCS